METREKDMKKISENEKMPQTKDVTDEIAVKSIEPDSILDSAKLVPIKDFVSPEELHKDLIQIIRKYHPSADISMVEKAYQIAAEAHKTQVRKSGEPYIIHPLYVAIILAELEMDKETIVAGLLHDVVEDTVMTDEEIKEEFGPEVALLVDGVTKLGQISYKADKVEVQAENLRKMFLAMAKDIRVIIIKLADRLHNMRTLKYMKPEKQKEKARETMDIYAPIAQRLGISKIKIELEDLSLKYLEPEAYYDLVEKIAVRKSARDKYVNSLVNDVEVCMKEAGIEATVMGRAKHFFSIYKKMVNQNKTLDQIYDLFAIRIIVKDVKDCYAALGVIHEKYKPIPGRFKDYIAMPKPNMYQSLHTTLIGPTGQPFEIQIRTEEMHRTSEYGIAAHWKYKEANNGNSINGEEEKLSWLRQILEWQRDMSDNKEFMSLLKSDLDLFSDSVLNIVSGKELLNNYCKAKSINFGDINKPEYQAKVQRKYGFRDWDSVLAAVGHGGLKESQIVNRMMEEYRKDHKKVITDEQVLFEASSSEQKEKHEEEARTSHKKSGIIVKGLTDVAVHFSKCCSPVPGDEIVGFVTRGRGVSIHRTDCINIMQLPDFDRQRLIEAEWQQGAADEENGGHGKYLAELRIFGNNRTGLLVDITKIFTERGIDINSINSRTSKKGIATIAVSFYTKGKDELSMLGEKIRQIESVFDIERTTG